MSIAGGKSDPIHIVDSDSDGATIDVTVLGDAGRYVTKIAVRKVVDSYRRKADTTWPTDFEPAGHEMGYDEILGRPLLQSVIDLIDWQPARRRTIALLFFLDEFSYAEIAEALAIAEPTRC